VLLELEHVYVLLLVNWLEIVYNISIRCLDGEELLKHAKHSLLFVELACQELKDNS
jgi:hypothetical protein